MPRIIVQADATPDRQPPSVLLFERVQPTDLESDHFAAQLIERIGWAVVDASEVARHA